MFVSAVIYYYTKINIYFAFILSSQGADMIFLVWFVLFSGICVFNGEI